MSHQALFLVLGVGVVLLVIVTFLQYGDIRSLTQRLDEVESNGPQAVVEILSDALLTKATEKSGCWDIYADQSMLIPVGGQTIMPTGIVTKMHSCDAIFFSRSGLSVKRVTHRAGFIDEDYPDEWKVLIVNEGREPYQIQTGDRVAQVFFIPKQDVLVIGGVILDKERIGGLGSTGV